MYVIRICFGEDSWKYLFGVQNQILVVTSIKSKAMVFHNRADALIMAAFMENYYITLQPVVVIASISVDEEMDFSLNYVANYFEL